MKIFHYINLNNNCNKKTSSLCITFKEKKFNSSLACSNLNKIMDQIIMVLSNMTHKRAWNQQNI